MSFIRRAAPLAIVVVLFGGCGGASTVASGTPAGGAVTSPAGSVGSAGGATAATGSGVKAYDCSTLLKPADLDAAAGFHGGTVTTIQRGDQAAAGEVIGVTKCAIAGPSADAWSGTFDVSTGPEATSNFDTSMDFAKDQGATALAGVGSEAVIKADDIAVDAWAKGANGVDVVIAVAYDSSAISQQAASDAVKQILVTILSRT